MRGCTVVLVVVVTSVWLTCAAPAASADLEEQLQVLSKQVTALLERRREDLHSIEENLRKKLTKSQEFEDVREEIRSLRSEVEQLRSGNFHRPHRTQEKNDHLTMKWLSNAVAELKTEVSEIQSTLNSTVILQNREQLDVELSLLKTDVSNLNLELNAARSRNVQYEGELLEVREELNSLKDYSRATAVTCGKTKNQLKAAQLEWNFNWKSLNEKSAAPLDDDPKVAPHPSRHQKLLRRHVVDLEKTARHLRRSNEDLQTKMLKLQEEMQILQKYVGERNAAAAAVAEESIRGNEVDHYLNLHKIDEVKADPSDLSSLQDKIVDLEERQVLNTNAVFNFTKQLTNFDKLHMAMLELLENVESIENKVNKNFPEFRKEISKLEVQVSETASKEAAVVEDQSNIRASMKAIGVSVSNLKDKLDADHVKLNEVYDDVGTLKTAANLQMSKLHDHILKSESSPVELNATKSTIHLVQELKSFEKEYKNIINKLPYDCTSVSGPDGVYLISPGEGEPIMAYCSDGWTTVQKRYDDSVDFNRNWNEYSNGFGSATGEHWLGNRNLHALTKDNCTKLQINMKDIYGKYWQANYGEFRVADYTQGFKLVVGKYSGNASDALDYQNGMEFSTVDNDRDISKTHCAINYEGGWWYSRCQHANLNVRYKLGMTWFDSSRNEWIAVATSEMKIKRRDVC